MFRFLVSASIAISPMAGLAQASVDWGAEGDWMIRINPANGNGCYAEKQFADGVLVRIGMDPERSGGFFAAYNTAWTHIEDGATGTLLFDFGNEKFAGEVLGRVEGDLHGGYAFFNNPNFVTEFAGRNTVKISGERGQEAEVDLAGTKRAVDAVRACQKEQPAAD